MSASDIRAAQTALNDRILGQPGIEGTAIGQTAGKACLKVYVSDASAERRVPSSFRGFPVVVERSGPFRRR
ncbi:MAG: hypothetical protein R3304_12780 [Longimicrobiales bacterium]|nr:hypothetical protein [Longimicrobiales bacterium]